MKTKTVYLYSEITNELVGEYEAQESPLEQGVFISPIFSTTIKPCKTKKNETAVFHESISEWSAMPDFRGLTGYVDGVEKTIDTIGPLPAGFSTEIPAPIVESKKATEKTMTLDQFRAMRLLMLDALTGIAGRLHRAGDIDGAIACDTAAQSLLDLLQAPNVIAAPDGTSTQVAILAAYKVIAGKLSKDSPASAAAFMKMEFTL